ncbi:MAG: Si-specific NAD(P)(+) transhydrogenase [Cellvibrionaceae bacterium]|nr:Si-specific NAD(P)(+) transhydrogenase [Cellvibrionaceae bacterium]
MVEYSYDVLVIGAGPAGEGAAMGSAKAGFSVGIVENRAWVGGRCLHKGTIPSKALRHVIRQLISFRQNKLFYQAGDMYAVSFPDVLKEAGKVIPKQVNVHSAFYVRNRVALHTAEARFIDPNTVEMLTAEGVPERATAKHIVIATGSRPYQPADIDFSHPRIYDSDSILTMQHTPRSMIIYGAGVIGCEYASIFAGLGVKVDLINTRGHLLSFLDDEISDALSYHLRDEGVMVRHLEELASIRADAHSVSLHLQSGKRIHADALLWSNGRTGNTDDLNLAAAGLEADSRGQIKVNNSYKTAVEHIYAAGDVVGWPSLASASYDQGRAIADSIAGKTVAFIDDVPTGIYTLPEISSLGKTERQLTDEKIPYEVGRAFFKSIARAQISGEQVGMLKLLFHIDTLEILGIHCFGAEAAEIIHIGQAVMKQKGEANSILYFVNTTFNYPTMAEAYRIAALAGLNRVQRV